MGAKTLSKTALRIMAFKVTLKIGQLAYRSNIKNTILSIMALQIMAFAVTLNM